MLKSSVASFTVNIHVSRKRETLFVNLTHKFGDKSLDILDIIEEALHREDVYQLNKNDDSEENTSQNPSSKKISLVEISAFKNVMRDDIRLYRYIFFKVKYGQNGDILTVEKNDGEEFAVTPDDFQHREFYAFLAFPDDDDAQNGVLMIEYRGQYGIKEPIEKVLKKCVANIGDEKFTLTLIPFAERAVVKKYIDDGKVSKLRLVKNAPARERGAAMQYSETEIIYRKPRGDALADYLLAIYDRRLARNAKSNIKEIDDFQPDRIKFEVETESGKRTYSSSNLNSHARDGMIREEMPEGVVRADGVTNKDKLLVELKRIFRTQHLNI